MRLLKYVHLLSFFISFPFDLLRSKQNQTNNSCHTYDIDVIQDIVSASKRLLKIHEKNRSKLMHPLYINKYNIFV